jgi:hypothetical protein
MIVKIGVLELGEIGMKNYACGGFNGLAGNEAPLH